MTYWKSRFENFRGPPEPWNDDSRNFRTQNFDSMVDDLRWQNDRMDYGSRNGPPSLFSRPGALSSSSQINSSLFTESDTGRENNGSSYAFRSAPLRSGGSYFNSPRTTGRIIRSNLVDSIRAKRILQKRALNAVGSGTMVTSTAIKRRRGIRKPATAAKTDNAKTDNAKTLNADDKNKQQNKPQKALEEWRLAIIWDNDTKANFNVERANLLIKRLEQILDDLPDDVHVPRFYTSGLSAGTLKMVCVDQKSADWVKESVPTITDLWEGCKLKVILQSEINVLTNVTITLMNSDDEVIVILKRIEKQNPEIKTEKWRLHREFEEDGKRHIVLSIDNDSITYLKNNDWKLYIGLKQVKLTQGVAKPNTTK